MKKWLFITVTLVHLLVIAFFVSGKMPVVYHRPQQLVVSTVKLSPPPIQKKQAVAKPKSAKKKAKKKAARRAGSDNTFVKLLDEAQRNIAKVKPAKKKRRRS